MTSCGCGGLALPGPDPICIKPVAYKAYDEAEAEAYCTKFGDFARDLALRCYTSNLVGREASLVLHGGGNTSVKMTATSKVGEDVEVLCIKGSGYNLDSIVPKGFPQVSLEHLSKMLELDSLSDIEMVNEFRTHMMDASSPTPSVETLLHALIPDKFVDHSHADAIVALADHELEEAKQLFAEAFGSELRFAVVPYKMPGFDLAGTARKVMAESGDIDCLILLKHGLFTWGPDAKSSYEAHIKAVSLAEAFIQKQENPELTMRPHVVPSERFFDRVTCTLRGVLHSLSGGDKHWIVRYKDSPAMSAFAQSEEAGTISQIGTITPDHVIRTKSVACVIRGLEEARFYDCAEASGSSEVAETPEGDAALREFLEAELQAYIDNYHAYFERNNARVGGIKKELDPLPRVLLVEHFGLFTVDKSPKACAISADIYEHTVPTILASMAAGKGKYEPVTSEELFDVEYWSLEQAKLKLGAVKPGKLQGRVAFVTGGGSGIGLETALLFAKEGACVFIADMVEDRVHQGVQAVAEARKDKFAAAGAVLDVGDREQVEAAFHQACVHFGGVDVVVSNAGIVVQAAPGMASVEPKDLERSMNVNFLGHQWVSSAAVRRMVPQGTGGCLLYNVSKAPLNPGPQLGPYCIAKAAALALMRQYCVEYGARKIRSNAVNADRVRTNLFDMDLVEARAKSRGLTAQQYFQSNLLGAEVLAGDVAQAFLSLAVAEKTTGSILTVDGGNIAAAPR
ncbi:Uncharacterized oxidoreductase YuxG (ORF2) [Durusdinium trenchii]|uniref:Uncharacterized oxidoreductase YuxG (ORF2) n=1 Tax=Durusdinium trenchii TaxID=1381693 RepID=A0ABP0IWX7_9DINO